MHRRPVSGGLLLAKMVKPPHVRVCEACVQTGDRWVHLRTLPDMRSGVVLRFLAASARERHAHSSNHPVIASAELGDRWLYCFIDEVFAEY